MRITLIRRGVVGHEKVMQRCGVCEKGSVFLVISEMFAIDVGGLRVMGV